MMMIIKLLRSRTICRGASFVFALALLATAAAGIASCENQRGLSPDSASDGGAGASSDNGATGASGASISGGAATSPSLGNGGSGAPSINGGAASGPGISSSGGTGSGSSGAGSISCFTGTSDPPASIAFCVCYPSDQVPSGDSGGTPVAACDTSVFNCCCANPAVANACFCQSISSQQISCSDLCAAGAEGSPLSSCP